MSTTVIAAIGAPDYPVLNAFMRDRSMVSLIMGPLGSGKTYAVCQRILAQMCEQEPNAHGDRRTRWLAVRNTFPELMGTTVKDFLCVFEGLGKMRYGGLQPPQFDAAFRLQDGTIVRSEVIFLALDREDAVRKIRGYQLTGGWMNEAKELVKPVVDMLQARCMGRYPSLVSGGALPTWYGMLGDTNAPDEDHWYYRLAEQERPAGWAFFRQPGGVRRVEGKWIPSPDAENIRNLVPGYYDQQVAGKSEDWIKVMLANEYGFVVTGKPVHPQYIDSVHTAREPIEPVPGLPLILGIDYGREPACAIWQHMPAMGRWNAIDEFVSSGMSASIFGPELKRYLDRTYPNYAVQAWGDPAGEAQSQATEDTPTRIMRAAGIPVNAAPSNSMTLRRAALANPCMRVCLDGKPALQVSPKAVKLRKGLAGGWVYRRMLVSGDERYQDKPDKGPLSHICEAAEYALLGGGEGRDALKPAALRSDEPVQAEYAF